MPAVHRSPGSPVHPRRRGEHTIRRRTPTNRRFIPAGAGNTPTELNLAWPRTVHPRRRGEHIDQRAGFCAIDGSSPQARGTPLHHVDRPAGERFIPAGAGNTSQNPTLNVSWSVHPRRRGEHLLIRSRCWMASGSSPQARGTPPRPGSQPGSNRFIPAGAGNTLTLRQA